MNCARRKSSAKMSEALAFQIKKLPQTIAYRLHKILNNSPMITDTNNIINIFEQALRQKNVPLIKCLLLIPYIAKMINLNIGHGIFPYFEKVPDKSKVKDSLQVFDTFLYYGGAKDMPVFGFTSLHYNIIRIDYAALQRFDDSSDYMTSYFDKITLMDETTVEQKWMSRIVHKQLRVNSIQEKM